MNTVHSIAPSPPLEEFVRNYVYYDALIDAGPLVRPVWANPHVTLSFFLGDRCEAYEYRTGFARMLPAVFVAGPCTGHIADLILHGRHALFLVIFQPGGFSRLFGVQTQALTDAAHAAADILGPEVPRLLQRLRNAASLEQMANSTEDFLLSRMPGAAPANPIHRAAQRVHQLNGQVRLADMIDCSGHGSRQFGRKFVEQLGLTPKLYARIVRLNFALRLKAESPARRWTQISHEAGYFDQTHLVKEFKALTSSVPTDYLRMLTAQPDMLFNTL